MDITELFTRYLMGADSPRAPGEMLPVGGNVLRSTADPIGDYRAAELAHSDAVDGMEGLRLRRKLFGGGEGHNGFANLGVRNDGFEGAARRRGIASRNMGEFDAYMRQLMKGGQ